MRAIGIGTLGASALLGIGLTAGVAAAAPRDAAEVEIDARDNTFKPKTVTVAPGTRLRFVNVGRNDHTVIPAKRDQREIRVRTRQLEPDEEAVVRLTELGTYRYYCSIHGTAKAGMIGAVKVTE